MNKYTIFDILGPIMIGPSSSHTAGACRIGNACRQIAGEGFNKVDIYLHGSFAKTYEGHGTDRALLGGLMGFDTDDIRIQEAFQHAEDYHLEYCFYTEDLGLVHPNTAKIILYYPDGRSFVLVGSSIGGGNISIININGVEIDFSYTNPTLIVKYPESKGIISYISSTIADAGYNIKSLHSTRDDEDISTLLMEFDEEINEEISQILLQDTRFVFAKYISVKR